MTRTVATPHELNLTRSDTFEANRAHEIWRRLRHESPASWSEATYVVDRL